MTEDKKLNLLKVEELEDRLEMAGADPVEAASVVSNDSACCWVVE